MSDFDPLNAINTLKPVNILIAEDDPDDQFLTQEAFAECSLSNKLFFVDNGEELMDFLYQREKYESTENAPRPGIIILDLNMPKKNGREALKEIRKDESLCQIPVIVLTTSNSQEDVQELYKIGVNSFITKPVTYDRFVKIVQIMSSYWFGLVELPSLY